MTDPARTYVDTTVELAPDVRLLPGTILEGRTVVGARLGDRPRHPARRHRRRRATRSSARPSPASRRSATAPPSARTCRCGPAPASPPARTSARSSRSKNSEIGEGAKVPHLSYVGDAEIGRRRQHRRRQHHRQLRRQAEAPHQGRRRRAHRLEHRARRAGRGRRRRLHGCRRGRHPRRAAGRAGQGRARPIEEGWVAKRENAATTGRTGRRRDGEGASLMELVSKKTLMLFAGQGNDELSEEIAECLDVPLGDVKLSTLRERRDVLPLRREHPRRRRVRGAEPLRADQRPHHGAAAHDRRRQARVGASHHRGVPLLRVRAPGPQGRGPRADLRAPARRPAHRRRRRPRRDRRPPHRADPGLLRLPGRPPHRGAAARRLPRAAGRGRRRRSSSPDAGGRQARPPLRQLPRRRRHRVRPRVHRQAPAQGHPQRRRGHRGGRQRSTAASACWSTT